MRIRAMYDSRRLIGWFAQDDSRKNGDDSRTDGDDSHKRDFLNNVFVDVDVYHGNSMRLVHDYYGFLIGSQSSQVWSRQMHENKAQRTECCWRAEADFLLGGLADAVSSCRLQRDQPKLKLSHFGGKFWHLLTAFLWPENLFSKSESFYWKFASVDTCLVNAWDYKLRPWEHEMKPDVWVRRV